MGQNDSIITLGLELAEETEKSVGEIVQEATNSGPQQMEVDPALEEARALNQQARDFEAAENARQLENYREGPEQ